LPASTGGKKVDCKAEEDKVGSTLSADRGALETPVDKLKKDI
jgi:hypothetical protein